MREVTQKTRVWIIPAIMLGKGPPPPFVRDFDLLVIDEAAWFNLIHDAPTKIPLEWLAPQWWEARAPHATASQKQSAIDLLAKIFSALASSGLAKSRMIYLLSWPLQSLTSYSLDERFGDTKSTFVVA
jgi:hypothetical protein